MCGGAIISDFIPRNRNRRDPAPDLWPDSFFAKPDGCEYDLGRFSQKGLPNLKRSQPILGKSLSRFLSLVLLVLFLVFC